MLITDMMLLETSAEKMRRWIPILEKYFDKLSEDDYCDLYDEIHEEVYGEILSDEKAESLVQDMKPYGQHWTIEEANKMISTSKFKQATKYYVLNMMYNDYHQLFGDDNTKYVSISELWLNDADSVDGDIKTYRYATKV